MSTGQMKNPPLNNKKCRTLIITPVITPSALLSWNAFVSYILFPVALSIDNW